MEFSGVSRELLLHFSGRRGLNARLRRQGVLGVGIVGCIVVFFIHLVVEIRAFLGTFN